MEVVQNGIAKSAMLNGYYIGNSDAVLNYFHFSDRATAGAIGTNSRDLSLMLPPGAAANLYGQLHRFKNGIVVFATATRAGNGAPAADLDANIFFK